MQADPRAIIDEAPMSRFQWGVVATMVALNALDGFDVLSISFASPGIAAMWGVDRASLGVVLSMELIGMALGSLVLGDVADRIGRRATIMSCLVAMAIGMVGAASARDVVVLSLWRVATGIGIGGMLAATNAAVAEAANTRRRSLAVVLMAAGYPTGSIVGGTIAAALLAHYDWRAVFVFGGVATLAMMPVVWWRAPESIAFLMDRRPADALRRINATLTRMGHPPVDALPPAMPVPVPSRLPLAAVFADRLARTTGAMTLAYLAQITTFYFILKWIPKIVVDQGFAPAAAAGVLVWASIGGLVGSVLFGLLTTRMPLRSLTIGAALLSVVAVTAFGRAGAGLATLSIAAAIAGFATNAGVVGLYALMAERFPVRLRATGTGFVIGVGRGGSALAPALAGLLFAAGHGLPLVALTMALGSAIAALALALLGRTAIGSPEITEQAPVRSS